MKLLTKYKTPLFDWTKKWRISKTAWTHKRDLTNGLPHLIFQGELTFSSISSSSSRSSSSSSSMFSTSMSGTRKYCKGFGLKKRCQTETINTSNKNNGYSKEVNSNRISEREVELKLTRWIILIFAVKQRLIIYKQNMLKLEIVLLTNQKLFLYDVT